MICLIRSLLSVSLSNTYLSLSTIWPVNHMLQFVIYSLPPTLPVGVLECKEMFPQNCLHTTPCWFTHTTQLAPTGKYVLLIILRSLWGASMFNRLTSIRVLGACSQYFPSIGRISLTACSSVTVSHPSASQDVDAKLTSMNRIWNSVAIIFMVAIRWLSKPKPVREKRKFRQQNVSTKFHSQQVDRWILSLKMFGYCPQKMCCTAVKCNSNDVQEAR